MAQLIGVLSHEFTQALFDVDQLDAQEVVCGRGLDMAMTEFFPGKYPESNESSRA